MVQDLFRELATAQRDHEKSAAKQRARARHEYYKYTTFLIPSLNTTLNTHAMHIEYTLNGGASYVFAPETIVYSLVYLICIHNFTMHLRIYNTQQKSEYTTEYIIFVFQPSGLQ